MVTPAASKDIISCWFKTRKSSILHPGQEYWIFISCRHRRTNQCYSTGSQEKQTILIHTASRKQIKNLNLRRDSTNTQFGFTMIFSVDFHNSPSKNTDSSSWFFIPFQHFSEHGYEITRWWQHRTNGKGNHFNLQVKRNLCSNTRYEWTRVDKKISNSYYTFQTFWWSSSHC